MSVHAIAQTGFGHGTNDLYDRARPSYQPLALSYIRSAVKSTTPINVVEIGAGTGIFTRALLAHPEWASSINQIKAVEPSAGMREVFSKTVRDERVAIDNGTFENSGVEDGWADLVVIAQAFHWCPDYDRAFAEFARILNPEGVVVLIWNLEDRDRARWVAELRNRIERHENNTPQFRLNLWRQAFETQSYKQTFQSPVEKVWPYDLPATVDIAVDRALSKSYIAILPEVEKAQIRKDVRNIVEEGEGKVWIDEDKGVFEYPYQVFVVVARKV
ncbi:putative methyltransferase [Lyophyllum shimeji]|uniref:Methyltransferase n=1 Tax=Lyophyllum shimeji TaxID=47721 RepID=A0A9P3PG69_LYOSH|nr:putative methyltransferase [Lyophyllum shimeji]